MAKKTGVTRVLDFIWSVFILILPHYNIFDTERRPVNKLNFQPIQFDRISLFTTIGDIISGKGTTRRILCLRYSISFHEMRKNAWQALQRSVLNARDRIFKNSRSSQFMFYIDGINY